MKAREVVLVIFLLLIGVVIYQVQTGGRWGLIFDDDGEFFDTGKAFNFEETQTIEAPLPSAIEIVNGHGLVEVRGGDQETIQLTFKKRIWRRKEEDAKDIAGRLHYILSKSGDRWSFSTNREEFAKRNFETDFILTVPRRMSLEVTNSYGPVIVEALKGADVKNRHGRVSASDIEGPCSLESSYEEIQARNMKAGCRIINRHADVRVESVAGDLTVDHAYGDVRFEDIGGKADITGSHSGIDGRRVKGAVTVETSYENVSLTDVGPARVRAHHSSVKTDTVRGDLDVQTSYAPVKARDIQGNLQVSGSNVEVTAEGIKGQEISVTSSHESVELSDFSAKVTISLRHGNIVLRPSDLKFLMDVRDEYGNIDLVWPSGGASPLEARSRGGSVKWGLAGKPALEKNNGESLVKAFTENTARPGVSLSTTYGDIRIKEN